MKTGRDALVLAFSNAYATVADSGSKITEVCKIANSCYKGAEVPKDDADYIVEKLADARGWKDATRKVRTSEARKVLSVYSVLPEGIDAVRKKTGACDWRAALYLATKLKAHAGKLRPALAAYFDGEETRKVSPKGRVAGALKRWYAVARGDQKKAILEAIALLKIELKLS